MQIQLWEERDVCLSVVLYRRLSNAMRMLRLSQQHSVVLPVVPHCYLSWSAGGIEHCRVFPSAVSYQYSVVMFVLSHY